jgi:hypothetical protein
VGESGVPFACLAARHKVTAWALSTQSSQLGELPILLDSTWQLYRAFCISTAYLPSSPTNRSESVHTTPHLTLPRPRPRPDLIPDSIPAASHSHFHSLKKIPSHKTTTGRHDERITPAIFLSHIELYPARRAQHALALLYSMARQ